MTGSTRQWHAQQGGSEQASETRHWGAFGPLVTTSASGRVLSLENEHDSRNGDAGLPYQQPTQVWQRACNEAHVDSITSLLDMKGLQYVAGITRSFTPTCMILASHQYLSQTEVCMYPLIHQNGGIPTVLLLMLASSRSAYLQAYL